jgi:tetratricopeptide (TPR) repeat protein
MNKPAWVLGPGAIGVAGDAHGPITVNFNYGTFDGLRDAIFDPSSLAKTLDLRHFTGREWLIARIDDYIASHPKGGYVIIRAEAGVGKTTLAAHLAWTRPCAYHFTRLDGARDPIQARRSLAAQLIGAWQLIGEDGVTGNDSFPAGADRLDWLGNVLKAAAERRDELQPGAPLVLVVDGLDEADPPVKGQDNGIPLGLPHPGKLPDGVYIVATTRFGVEIPVLYDDSQGWYEIVVDGPDNLEDMRRYLAATVKGQTAQRELADLLAEHFVDPDWFADELARRCGGVWIYLRYVLEAILRRHRNPDDLESLPSGVIGYYLQQVQQWQRHDTWPTAGRRTLAVLAASQRPATLAELADICQTDKDTLHEWLDGRLRSFLDVGKDDQRNSRYAIRHQSLRDLFSDAERDGKAPWESTRDVLREAFAEANALFTAFHRRQAKHWSKNTQTLPYARYEAIDHLFQARRHLVSVSLEDWPADDTQEIAALIIGRQAGGDEPADDAPATLLAVAAIDRYLAETPEPSLWGFASFIEEPSFYLGAQLVMYLDFRILDPVGPSYRLAAEFKERLVEIDENLVEEAFTDLRKAVRGRLAEAGPEQRDESCMRLAALLDNAGEPTEAERFYREALAIRHRRAQASPGDHNAQHGLCSCYEGLGNVLTRQADVPDFGRLAEGRDFLEKALAIRTRHQGSGGDTLRLADQLASLLEEHARLAQARYELAQVAPLYARALDIREQFLEASELEILSSLDQFVWLLVDEGKSVAARPLCERALWIAEREYGPDSQATADRVNQLAWVLHDEGKLAEARTLYERAVRIRRLDEEPGQLNLSTSLHNLALLLHDQGEYAQSRSLFEQALSIAETRQPDHSDTAATLCRLGCLLIDQGEVAQAEPLLTRSLRISEEKGANHLGSAYGLIGVAKLRLAEGDPAEASTLAERALAIMESTRGPEHWHTGTILCTLGQARQVAGDTATATRLYERALKILERSPGPDHPDSAKCLHRMAGLKGDLGDSAAARSLYQRALEIRISKLGTNHPDTVAIRQELDKLSAGHDR